MGSGSIASSIACKYLYFKYIILSNGYSRSNLNSSVNFISYLVIGNLTMMETDCYNVSHIQRPIDDRLEFCKKRKY